MKTLGSKTGIKVYSVIVCYRPRKQQLFQLCENLLISGSEVVLVDNTEVTFGAPLQFPSSCRSITIGFNSGIAYAQNVGATAAVEAGADVVAFFDQDSTITPGFIDTLVSNLNIGKADIVAPLYIDETSSVPLPSIRVNRFGVPSAVHCNSSSTPYQVDIVISSGTTVTKEVFKKIGLFDEAFFIDFVDTEWCLRCRSNKVQIRVIPSVVMKSRIGSQSIDLGITTIFVHSPLRCYYQLRNCFHLFRRKHIPFLFALKETASVFLSRGLLLLVVRDKLSYSTAYLCALRDGIRGVTGSKPR